MRAIPVRERHGMRQKAEAVPAMATAAAAAWMLRMALEEGFAAGQVFVDGVVYVCVARTGLATATAAFVWGRVVLS